MLLKNLKTSRRISIDVTKIERFLDLDESFPKRICSASEFNKYISITNKFQKAKYLAKLWCLKEAAYKLLNNREKLFLNKLQFVKNKNRNYVCLNNKKLIFSLSYEANMVFVFGFRLV